MAIDRNFWKDLYFEDGQTQHFRCPSCHRGSLVIKDESLHVAMTAESRSFVEEEWYSPNEDVSTFSCMLICTNPDCQEAVGMAGHVYTNVDEDRRKVRHPYHPKVFFPPLQIFPIHDKCPEKIKNDLVLAFALFWTDQSGSMNHLRNAVEILLDGYRIARFAVTAKKRRRRRTLHERIVELRAAKNTKELADRIEAVKWLGNEGSHAGEVSEDDVLDAFELFESIIEMKYVRGERAIARIASEINRRRKPRRRK